MITIHEDDTLSIEVPVSFDPGGTVTSLAGATAAASCRLAGVLVVGATAISGDTITCSWPAGALSAGHWRFQVKVTVAGLVQTVAEETVRVRPSN